MYSDDQTWKELQSFLPEKNRISGTSQPAESYVLMHNMHVHIDEYEQGADTTVIIFHGVGGNGRIVSFFAVPLAETGYNVICPDLPGYGYTQYKKKVTYTDWIEIGSALVQKELQKSRTVFLIGLSAGGMLAYNIACKNSSVSGLIVTNILDNREEQVRLCSAKNRFQAKYGLGIIQVLPRFMRNFKIPIKMVTNMNGLVNDKNVLAALLKDKRGPGSKVDLNFLVSMMNSIPVIEPQEFRTIPVLMVHPENDLWTPVQVSDLFFSKIAADKKRVLLDKAGHFPIEEPGLSIMENEIRIFIKKYS